jgi:murein DD-endopeptidase MepM/ murein hydrolase activator NlpD
LASSASARSRRAPRITAALLGTLLLGLIGASAANRSSAAAVSAGGGAAAPGLPAINDVICVKGCAGLRKATVGGLVQVSGRNLSGGTKMTFASADGRVAAPITEATDRMAEARVPAEALDGKVRVRDDFGNASKLSASVLEVLARNALLSSGPLVLLEAEASPPKAYFFGVRAPSLRYVIGSEQALNDLRVDVIGSDGAIVKSIFRQDVEANATQSVRWNGKTTAGTTAPSGRYSFRVSSMSGERATRANREGALGFKLFGYIFPVRGPHTYGDGIGAPRAGHTHQGQDVFAACGTTLVAARGGRVQYAGYHSAAGNYIVIDGKSTGIDFAYMHLVSPAQFREGQMVRTGQRIGQVGESGNASGCHLHYEMWGPPGWYEGGHFLDPAPALHRWDRYS